MRQVCVVTGASSGIGRATAIELARRGVALVLSGRHLGRLEETGEKCRESGVAGHAVPGDIADSNYCDELVAAAVDLADSGGVSVGAPDRNEKVSLAAVFAAGTAAFGPTHEFPDLAWKNTMEANLTGLFYCCRSMIRAMRDRGGGRIVNVISIAAKQPFPQSAAYVATKYGALGMTHSLANEYRSEGIYLTAFVPGSVDTPLWQGMNWTPERADMLTAEDVAKAIANIVTAETNGVYDEVVFMPKKGVL